MKFALPELPYEMSALEPHISAKTLEYHYGKHHKAYVDKLNTALETQDFGSASLEEIITKADGGLYNNAAQAWNHSFYWYGMDPQGGGVATGDAAAAIDEAFGDFATFKQQFTETAATHFGSGWAWLALKDGKLEIMGMHDADSPLKVGAKPVLALDVWEHAYYLDYQNARPDYITAFWNVVDWEFVNKQLITDSAEPLMKSTQQSREHTYFDIVR
jgi:Fe-Mn family superoxide dismutase